MPDTESTGTQPDSPAIEIKSISGGRTLYVSRLTSVRAALVEAANKGADLRGAYLQGADLQGADLRGADLRGAYLQGADLQGADLRGAYLQGADLQGADLQDADLQGADLQGAYLQDAYLQDAKNAELAIAKTRIIPDDGDIIGWKKARDGRIVKLLIGSQARRSHASGRKCRSDRAVVLDIFTSTGESVSEAFSQHDSKFRYVSGETVTPKEPFDTDMWNECSSGIHWYITRLEAENHV